MIGLGDADDTGKGAVSALECDEGSEVSNYKINFR